MSIKPGKNGPHSPDPTSAEFSQLVALYNARRFVELESRTQALLRLYPASGFAWKLLGAAQQMQGKNALAAFQKTAELMPKDAEAHFNLGVVQKTQGLLREAADNYRRALKLNPYFIEAIGNLGNVLRDLGQIDEAVTCYRNVLKLQPNSPEAHNNLGTALKELGQREEAVACFRRAVSIKPNYADAHYNLGNTLKEAGNLNEAAACYRKAAELNPALADAHINLGSVLKELGMAKDALTCYRKAQELKPDSAELQNNMGAVLKHLKQYDEAETCFRRAIELKPDFAEAYGNLGALLTDFGQLDDAIANYRRALEIRPDFEDALDSMLFVLCYSADFPPASYLAEARQYGQIVTRQVTARFSSWQCTPSPERLRVGLVSGDLRIHSVGRFIDGLLPHIDPARIELIAYPTYLQEDELAARIKPLFAAWKPLAGMNDETAARLIHDDGVHVLLDISGHTAHNRLPVFAWKPAPVQANWLGLPSTTGVEEMDYILGDAVAIPPEYENQLSEKVWRLPECYVCFSAPDYRIEVATLPALSTGHVTFGSFNNLSKVNDKVVELWSRILLAVPNSHLYLKAPQLNDAGIRKRTQRRFSAWGVDPGRLLLGKTQGSIAEHLAEYNKVDIALDTFPYTGTTTNIEALWMGVPVLSLQGDRFLTLSAASIAHHAGLPDWVAHDKDDYVAKAVSFAADLKRLAARRAGLREQVLASPVFDVPRFARNFENALWGMWQAHLDRNKQT